MKLPQGDLQAHAPAQGLETGQRLALRAGLVVALWLTAWVVTSLRDLHPDPLRLLLVVAVVGAMAWLLVDAVVDQPPGWRQERPDPHDWLGHDPRTGFYVQLIDDHLAEREREHVLKEQLLELATHVTLARHGTADDLQHRDPQLAAQINRRGRLDIAQIDAMVTRISQL